MYTTVLLLNIPTQPYIETDLVPSQLYTEKTNSETETIRAGPITMATESMHSVSNEAVN
jgi:hypothetical protein